MNPMLAGFLSFWRSPLSFFDRSIAFGIGFAILFFVMNDCVNRQWDFPVYYLAAHAIASHQNPYDPAVLQSIADSQDEVGYGGGLPYLYPPHLARLLSPFAHIPFFTAAFLWMTAKCLALETILFLSLILMKIPITPWALILVHGVAIVYRPIALDFNAGNVATFETLLLLAGVAAWSRNRTGLAGMSMLLGGSFKGSSLLLLLYPIHLRDRRLIRSLILSALALGVLALTDWRHIIQFFQFYRSPLWIQFWDEQVQSFYNCSSVTVILRTFSDTYFAEPLIRLPLLANILIPLFPIVIFLILAFLIQKQTQNRSFDKTHGLLLSLILCGILLLPPRLAGYTLVWTLFPLLQTTYLCWTRRVWIPASLLLAGFLLIQWNLPPNHIPLGIAQLLIDKDFFGLLLLFTATALLTTHSFAKIDNPPVKS